MMNQREEAIEVAAKALSLTTEFDARIVVTQRFEIWSGEVSALNIETAADKLQRYWEERKTDYGDIEGDQLGYVSAPYHPGGAIEVDLEVDLRDKGEPFSWVACILIKRLAEADPDSGLSYWISRAKEALK